MNFVLFDDPEIWKAFLPLTFTRPLSEIRTGILTTKEKWDKWLGTSCGYITQEYLSEKFPNTGEEGIYINSSFCPDASLVEAVKSLKTGQSLVRNSEVIAFHGQRSHLNNLRQLEPIAYKAEIFELKNIWDIFKRNDLALRSDFELVTKGRTSKALSPTVTVIGDRSQVFLEESAIVEACILNTKTGPIYVGKDAEIMEGSVVRGGLAMCEHATLKLSSKIYGTTTLGPHVKIGGEVNNSVILGYSNKGHDGFLGNSVIGEWCNLGADTNNSNLKNNYGNVKLFSYRQNKQVDTGLQFCGLIMGDHSKAGINTMFNTGTVAGVGCNIYGGGFPSTVIPNFSWGGSEGFEAYKLDKLFETATRMYERRGMVFREADQKILKFVYEGKVKL